MVWENQVSKKISTQQLGIYGQLNTIQCIGDYFCPTNSQSRLKFRKPKWSLFTNWVKKKTTETSSLCNFMRLLEDLKLKQTLTGKKKIRKSIRTFLWKEVRRAKKGQIHQLKGIMGIRNSRTWTAKKIMPGRQCICSAWGGK